MKKNLKQLGSPISRSEAKEIKGGYNISCKFTGGKLVCTVRCNNGSTFQLTNCFRCTATVTENNGVWNETVTCCGVVLNC